MTFSYNHWSGEKYSENALLQEKWAKKFFFDSYDFKGTEHILDIGCGDGKITSKLAEHVPKGRVLGIDKSSTMVNQGKTQYKTFYNLDFQCSPAQETSFYKSYKNTFDLVTSFTALHWVKEQRDVLKGVYEALKPNGRLYFRLCSDGSDPIYEIATELANNQFKNDFLEFSDPLYRFSVKEYEELLKDANFKILSVKNVEDKDIIKDFSSLKKQVMSHLPHYHFLRDNISLENSEIFLQKLLELYMKRFPLVKTGIVLIDHYLEVIAQKGYV